MIIKGRQIESFLANPPKRARAVLIYGPDQVRIQNWTQTLFEARQKKQQSLLGVDRLDGDAIEDRPSLLYDRLATVPLGGGTVLLHAPRPPATAEKPLLEALDSLDEEAFFLIATAERLEPRHRLRVFFEKRPDCACLAVYAGETKDIAQTLQACKTRDQLTVDRDAQDFLCARLATGTLTVAAEIEKLSLYAGPKGHIDMAAIEAVFSDSQDLYISTGLDAVFSGDLASAAHMLDGLWMQGTQPIALIRAGLAHISTLSSACLLREKNRLSPAEALNQLPVKPFFKRRTVLAEQIRIWDPSSLARCQSGLLRTEIACREASAIQEQTTRHAFWSLARLAYQRRRRHTQTGRAGPRFA